MDKKFGYRIMYFMHDNPILRKIRDPYKILKKIGVKENMVVLDVGSGPGFYTIPASKIVGPKGKVYALDIYEESYNIINKKKKLNNIEFLLRDARNTSLPDNSVDFIIMFGIIHNLDFLLELKNEMKRILKSNGCIAIEKTPIVKKSSILKIMNQDFILLNSFKSILIFRKA